ncbi:hypothetical protein L1987_14241 [Smallanthus sonchifolius]|uniref:Uncharacterized protein n=1 Tax=Smallanthus sonchifolius TaxID=185202 RepID=A0ACB9J4D6_9ASTR|nr:hypothetical protein L1987_14241 [Smallanthus sonchifolius]
MLSAADGGSAGDGGGGNVNISPLLRTLAKGVAITLGGIFSITMISSTTVQLFTLHKKNQIGSSSSSSSMNKKNAISCDVCRAKGFYMCKLCKGNATIEWSPLYDPVFINPCLCPTCEGHRIQRCLNCLGSGFIQQPKVTGCISVIVNMNLTDAPMDSGGSTESRGFKFGSTYVVEPKGKHQATIVWLHGLGDDGLSWSQVLETLPLPNIKWICPTSPVQPLTLFGGNSTTAWFDVVGISEDASPDVQGMDASAAHTLSLLSTEPQNIKLGVGGFSMGAATAIYSASCFACGKFGNQTGCPTRLDAVVGLSGWLPCARALSNKGEGYEVDGRASLPILLCHGRVDDVVLFHYGERSAEKLTSAGFENVTFKPFNLLGHYINREEMAEVASWLTSTLELEGKS